MRIHKQYTPQIFDKYFLLLYYLILFKKNYSMYTIRNNTTLLFTFLFNNVSNYSMYITSKKGVKWYVWMYSVGMNDLEVYVCVGIVGGLISNKPFPLKSVVPI